MSVVTVTTPIDATAPAAGRTKRARTKLPRSLVAGLIVLGVLLALAVCAPLLSRFSPTEQHIADRLQGPSGTHWLGTDQLGRDVFSRVLHAARIDLRVGMTAVLAPFAIGTTLGLLAGYYQGKIGTLVMRAADVVMAFPYYVIVIALVFALGPGTKGMYVALALVVWSSYARIVYGEVLSAARADYVLAARAGGLGDLRVMARHVLPNCITQAVVYATSDIVVIVLGVVTLSYLGLGVPPPTAEWGSMILDARPFIQTHPTLMLAPGVAVVLTGLAFSLIGDGLARVVNRSEAT